jgi:hypothetical protein
MASSNEPLITALSYPILLTPETTAGAQRWPLLASVQRGLAMPPMQRPTRRCRFRRMAASGFRTTPQTPCARRSSPHPLADSQNHQSERQRALHAVVLRFSIVSTMIAFAFAYLSAGIICSEATLIARRNASLSSPFSFSMSPSTVT